MSSQKKTGTGRNAKYSVRDRYPEDADLSQARGEKRSICTEGKRNGRSRQQRKRQNDNADALSVENQGNDEKKMVSVGRFTRALNGTTVDNHHLVELGSRLAPFQAFVGRDTAGAHVEVEESYASDVIVISAVATQTHAAAVTHPKGRFLVCILLQHAIVVDMVAV